MLNDLTSTKRPIFNVDCLTCPFFIKCCQCTVIDIVAIVIGYVMTLTIDHEGHGHFFSKVVNNVSVHIKLNNP